MVRKKLSAWTKNNLREIKHTLERYIAILAIITLGVAFFAGLVITRDAMVATLDKYLTDYNMYDYRLLSTIGFDKDDNLHFSSLEGIKSAEGSISIDFIAQLPEESGQAILKAHSMTDESNQLHLISGNLPNDSDECVVDSMYLSSDYIGKTILVSPDNEEETIESFSHSKYTIVGTVKSTEYISQQRGTTSLANGSLDSYIYIPEDGFDTDYYTEIYISLEEEATSYSKEYADLVDFYESDIQTVLNTSAEDRFKQIIDEANEKIAEAEEEYQDGYKEYLSEKEKAIGELEEAYSKLIDGQKEIDANEKKLLDGEEELKKGWKKYYAGIKKYEEGLEEYNKTKLSSLKTLEDSQKEIDANRTKVNNGIEEIEDSGVLEQYNELKENLKELQKNRENIENAIDISYASEEEFNTNLTQVEAGIKQIEETGVLETYTQLKEALIELDKAQAELDKGYATANLEFEKAEADLKTAKSELNDAYKTLTYSQKEIDEGKKSLKKGQTELDNGFIEYENGKVEAEEEFAEVEKELEDARLEIKDGKKEVASLEEPTTYIFDRSHNSGYSSFDNDSAIVAGIAKVLPIFFFFVAALVCSSTMSRMVDEQRTQIGTLKALGYSNRSITYKYVFYAGSAALFACVIGYYLGSKFFPVAIWTAYGMLYDFSNLVYVFDIKLALISLVVSLLCSAGVTYLTCKNELLQAPAQLIRPKSPKAGKRILLERIPAIWKHISFLRKVSIRNIFRYKKRLLMTVMGIAGCTALILAALGIKDSISNIADYQFDDIMTYDYEIYYVDEQNKDKKEKYTDLLSENVFVTKETFELLKENKAKTFYLIATDDKSITNIINFHYKGQAVSYPKDGEVLLSQKLAEQAAASIGDTVTIKISDSKNVEAVVGGIFENYIDNFMYMTDNTYKMLFNEEAKPLNSFAKVGENDLDNTTKILLEDKDVATVISTHFVRDMVDDAMKSLDYVVWLVLGFALALAFVVVYNLNNINITERAHEIATLKVLGFYPKETHSYVYRENIFLTALGIFVGLLLGNCLLTWIMKQIQVDFVSFKQQIFPQSFLIASITTFLLTILVNWILRGKIDRIDMTDSLNSGE